MHDDFGGLHRDLDWTQRRLGRREALRLSAVGGFLYLLGCDESMTGVVQSPNGECSVIPTETAGPFPGDGSNGPNVLTQTGVVRQDIRTSFDGLSGTADGIPMLLTLALVDVSDGCTPLEGYAVYAWHCDRGGLYSLYSAGATDQNYLRGVQESDANGNVTFQTIFPACYAGRWPHVHFEVYSSLAAATSATGLITTSQLALPESDCADVFATAGYEQSVTNLAQLSLATDGIFADGVESQLATVTGDVNSGYTATLTVGV